MIFVILFITIITLVLLARKREYTYIIIIVVMLIVSLPLSIRYSLMEYKPIETILWIDKSESMKGKIQNIDKLISKVNPDSIRFFGFPNNDISDFINLDTNKINIIISDFLLELPTNIISSNTIFVPVTKNIITNHLIKKIYFTNISQIDYLIVDLFTKDSIKVYSTKGIIFTPSKISNKYLIPISSLPDEVTLHSVNTNITIKTRLNPEIGVLWFDLNPDFLRFSQVTTMYNLKCDYFLKITKTTNFQIDKNRFSKLVVGYPSGDTKIDRLAEIVKEGGRIVIISPDESFIKQIFKTTKIENAKVTTSSFPYSDKYKVFEMANNYIGTVDIAFKYQYPITDLKDVEVIEKNGYVVAFKYKNAEFLLLMIRNINRFDKEMIKSGVLYSFSEDIYSNLLKFLIEDKGEITSERLLSESAFDGGIVPEGRVLFPNELDKLNNLRRKVPVINVKEENISQWWLLMLLIVLLISIKWILKG